MWKSCFKKFLEVIFRRPILSLEMAFDNRYELLAGVTGFLIAITVTSHHGNAMGSTLLSLLATLSAFPGGLGGYDQTIIGSRSHITRMKAAPTASSPEACRVAPWWFSVVRGRAHEAKYDRMCHPRTPR
jgi:hypothetical protein